MTEIDLTREQPGTVGETRDGTVARLVGVNDWTHLPYKRFVWACITLEGELHTTDAAGNYYSNGARSGKDIVSVSRPAPVAPPEPVEPCIATAIRDASRRLALALMWTRGEYSEEALRQDLAAIERAMAPEVLPEETVK